MRRRYKFKDTKYSVSSKKLLRYAKRYGIRLKSCEKTESMRDLR